MLVGQTTERQGTSRTAISAATIPSMKHGSMPKSVVLTGDR